MMSEPSTSPQPEKDTLAILTLRRHQDGVWIHRLVEALQQQQHQHDSQDEASAALLSVPLVKIQVVVLEDFLQGPFCVSISHNRRRSGNDTESNTGTGTDVTASLPRWMGLVNRVSDAAKPWEVKACLALLQLAKLIWNIPIWNGPDAYSLCTHKWCHHMLFQKANLDSPETAVVLQADDSSSSAMSLEMEAVNMLHQMQRENTKEQQSSAKNTSASTLDYLVKPNAGGFGAGIERRQATIIPGTTAKKSPTSSSSHADSPGHTIQLANSLQGLPDYSDRFILFQNYIIPKKGKIYRVWFLMGKVQCAVERAMDLAESSKDNTASGGEEFTSGCVGGVCQLRPKEESSLSSTAISHHNTIQPWSVSEEVQRDIEENLAPVLPQDAHCGSVEFLFPSDDDSPDGGARRLYFDLNLLSTLPIDDDMTTDPWLQLARAIWTFVYKQKRQD